MKDKDLLIDNEKISETYRNAVLFDKQPSYLQKNL